MDAEHRRTFGVKKSPIYISGKQFWERATACSGQPGNMPRWIGGHWPTYRSQSSLGKYLSDSAQAENKTPKMIDFRGLPTFLRQIFGKNGASTESSGPGQASASAGKRGFGLRASHHFLGTAANWIANSGFRQGSQWVRSQRSDSSWGQGRMRGRCSSSPMYSVIPQLLRTGT
jgi:hypothetical protein